MAATGCTCTAAGGFPTNTFNATNYFVDVVFDTTLIDTSPPTVINRVPASGATAVPATTPVSATFSEPVVPSTISVVVTGPGSVVVPGATAYDAGSRTATFTPTQNLAYSTVYTVNVSGAKDAANNTMAPVSWSFTTGAAPPPLPTDGPGGPIGVVTSGSDPFSGYFAEIMRAEGLNSFATLDVTTLNPTALALFRTVVLGHVTLTTQQVTDLTTWVNGGGNLIASRPDAKLAPLLGLTVAAGTLGDAYLSVNTATQPGAGIVSQTMQFHGTADRYTLSGATAIATLYSTATHGHDRTRRSRCATVGAQWRPGGGVHVRPRPFRRVHAPGQPGVGRPGT